MAETHHETITVRGDGITLSLLVWRRFRRPMPGLVEQVYDINPGLGDLGPILPYGTIVTMPIPSDEGATETRARITLW